LFPCSSCRDYSIQTYVDFLNEFLRDLIVSRATLVGESLGGWIVALDAVEESSGAHMVPLDKLAIVDGVGLKQDKPIPNLNPSTLEEMRQVMKVVVYDTSWLDDATLRRIFTDKLASNDFYTVHSIMNNPTVQTQLLDNRLDQIRVPTRTARRTQPEAIGPAFPTSPASGRESGPAGCRATAFAL
jgi:pimeloyl-ACP methyl ester carboxylesterase